MVLVHSKRDIYNIYMTYTRLAKQYLGKWKKKFRLEDWKIEVSIMNSKDFKQFLLDCGDTPASVQSSEDTIAATNAGSVSDKTTQHNVFNRDAVIAIQYQDNITDDELESIIVHEMLHIMLSHISPYETDLEVATVEEIVLTLEEALLTKGELNGKTKRKRK
jgi:hypothetical protein